MSIISTVEARTHFSDVINQVIYAKEHITLSRHGREVAAIVPLEDLQLLEKLEDSIDIKEALAAKKEMQAKGGIKWEIFKKEENF